MVKKLILSFLILLGGFSIAETFGQKLVIRMNSGLEHQDELDLIQKLYFSGGDLIVDFYSGPDDNYNLSVVQKLYFDSTVSVAENPLADDSESNVYPNPAGDHITLTGIPHDAGFISVFGTDGRLVLREPITGKAAELNVSGLYPGLYLVNAAGYTTKFVKK